MDDPTHQKAQTDAHHEGEEDADQGMNAQYGGAVGDKHAGQGGNGTDRQVNAAGDEDHGHAHGGDAVIGIVDEHVHEGPQRRKALIAVGNDTKEINHQEDADGGVHHDVLRVGQTAEETLPGGQFILATHFRAPPLANWLRDLVRLAKCSRTGSDCSTITTAMMMALNAMVASDAMPK